MARRWILALMVTLLATGPVLAQKQGDRRGGGVEPPRTENRQNREAQPGADRRSRIDRAERSIRERRDGQGGKKAGRPDLGDGMIYRRSKSFRRW